MNPIGFASLISLILATVALAQPTPCVISGGVCTITVSVNTGSCPDNVCALTTSPAGDILVPTETTVRWKMASGLTGTVYSIFLPDPSNKIFEKQIFKSIPGTPDGGQATAPHATKYSAEYLAFWMDGAKRAYLDPRVVVAGNPFKHRQPAVRAKTPLKP